MQLFRKWEQGYHKKQKKSDATTNIRQHSQLDGCQILKSMWINRFPLKIMKNGTRKQY